MTERHVELVREVERVVTAPYVPALQDLNDLICRRTLSTNEISLWAISKPCQVGLLADVLIEALSRSLVALTLITVFASSSEFRDALLERHPVLLDAFLEKAVTNEGVEYSTACVALLSSPLPAGIVPPARIVPFITKLVGVMAKNPCTETIAPIHGLISGIKGSPRILDDIPSDVMSILQLEFTKTLRNLDDHMGNLLCLATFAQIAMALNPTSQSLHASDSPTWLVNIRHFFGEKRGLKTLDLVVLRVILACSLSPDEAIGSIRLAICIADAIEPEQKKAWIAGNSSKIAKLCEKADREGLSRDRRTMVIIFLYTLLPLHSFPSRLRERGLDALQVKDSHWTLLKEVPRELLPRLIKSLAASGKPTAHQLLTFALDVLKGSRCSGAGTMEMLHLADLILAGLEGELCTSSCESVIDIIDMRDTLSETLEYFPREPSESQCGSQIMCTWQLYAMQTRLALSTFEIYHDLSFPVHGDSRPVKSFTARVKSVLKASCAFSGTKPKDFRGSFTLRDRHDLSTHINRDWRSGITELLRKNAQTSQETMMRKIEDTCFDLERRCNDIEGPLRAAEAERDRFAHENEELRRENEELKNRARQSSESLAELGNENTRLKVSLEELAASLGSVQEELQELQRSSEQAILTEREESRSKELETIATLTEKEDQLEELQEKIRDLRMRNEEARQTVDQLTSEKATLSDLSTSLKQELVETVNASKQAILRADQTEDRMLNELVSLKSKVNEQNSDIGRLTSALQEADGLRGEIESLNTSHQAEAARAMSEIAKHETEKCRLQAALKATSLEASKAAESNEKRIQYLERKVQALRDERASKAREFSEAQQHISRLMGVMGFSTNAPETNAPLKRRRTRSSMHPTTPAARVSQPISDDQDGTQITESFESMASDLNESTPKRPRGNSKTTNGLVVPANSFAAGLGPRSKSPSPTSRVPHAMRKSSVEADRNSPTKSQPRSVSKHSQSADSFQEPQAGQRYDNRLQDLDLDMNLEFSRDFLYTSTDLTRSGEQTDQ
ncbi:hypothetical protein N7535_007528 [Penicillium sp. DV-2018c]|nr:hypothetical protein N7461_003553 [Penicillium sp. DV-2018c]KAJ5565890.1 hypothetical protein N7535_007528 [Penicillium sp. DV-2018c]